MNNPTQLPWITTYSGRRFFLTRATPNDIFIEDIAHGLSNICRYVGQCREFYSVAEHSVRMAEVALTPRMKLLALLHDAPEAYIGDMGSLLKASLPQYKAVESYLMGVIGKRFSLEEPTSFEIATTKLLDEQIRTPEVLSLFPVHEGWVLLDFDSGTLKPYGTIHPWSPKKAERKFFKMFKELYGRTKDNRKRSAGGLVSLPAGRAQQPA